MPPLSEVAGGLMLIGIVAASIFLVAHFSSSVRSNPFHEGLALLSRDKIVESIATCYDAFDEGPNVSDQDLVKASVCPRGVANQAGAIADWTGQAIDDWTTRMADEEIPSP